MKLFARLAAVLALVVAAAFAAPSFAAAPAGTPHLLLQLKDGTVDIELEPKLAPNHVERIVTLTRQGFYNGLKFHRVIAGFMAQTGDPKGDGTGGSSLPDLKAEFSNEPFVRGTLAGPAGESWSAALGQAVLTLPIQLLVSALSTGVIHGAARVMFGASGRFIALLRVLWLASIVGWLGIVPVVGGLVAGVWSLLITLVTFEEIDGVERLQALLLVVAFGALSFVAMAFGAAAFR